MRDPFAAFRISPLARLPSACWLSDVGILAAALGGGLVGGRFLAAFSIVMGALSHPAVRPARRDASSRSKETNTRRSAMVWKPARVA